MLKVPAVNKFNLLLIIILTFYCFCWGQRVLGNMSLKFATGTFSPSYGSKLMSCVVLRLIQVSTFV